MILIIGNLDLTGVLTEITKKLIDEETVKRMQDKAVEGRSACSPLQLYFIVFT